MNEWFEQFWHKTLGRPFLLKKAIDEGTGKPVIFLHGIGASAANWRPVIDAIDKTNYRAIGFDLLGFGSSPKTTVVEYSVDDHVASIVWSIKRARIKQPFILVGHSMGCLVAARLTRLYPELVERLILYQVPVYSENDQLMVKDARNKAYLKFYTSLADNPQKVVRYARLLGGVTSRIAGFTLDPKTWYPFEQSLRNTIISQNVLEDLQAIRRPVDIVYGNLDLFVLKRSTIRAFAKQPNVNFHSVAESHRITKRAARVLIPLIV